MQNTARAFARLAPYVSEQFPSASGDRVGCPELESFYREYNGGYYWNRALLIRPKARMPHLASIAEWNEPGLWRNLYDDACGGAVFFAEDAFGLQFGIQANSIVQFDPETASISAMAPSLDEWISSLVKDAAYLTGAPVLAAWEKVNTPIAVGYRLIPKQPFMLGGEFNAQNMIAKPDLEGMMIRAQLWSEIRNLPDGQRIILDKSEKQ
jgi:hypothetical protein